MLPFPIRYPALLALAEDLALEAPAPATAGDRRTAQAWLAGQGAVGRDRTTAAVVPTGARVNARIVARADGILAGLEAAAEVFRLLDPEAEVVRLRNDGDPVTAGDHVLQVQGSGSAVLVAERTALNLLQRLCGVATATHSIVKAVGGEAAVEVKDTRKTTPGLRALERAAVRAGGGVNHRDGLYDQVLLKENHFALSGLSLRAAVARAVEQQPAGAPPVIAEARDPDEAHAAVAGGAGVVLLDNFSPGAELKSLITELRHAAQATGRPLAIEVSGGITPATAGAYARCGVDRLSVGMLTHSAPSLDLSMLMEPAVEVQHG